jgi:hypothetical protein
MSAETPDMPETPPAEAAGPAWPAELALETEKPPLARAGRAACDDDDPDGPVTFMEWNSRTWPTIIGAASPFG